MSQEKHFNPVFGALATGGALAGAWYAAATTLLGGTSGEAIATVGAVAIAAVVPILLLRKNASPALPWADGTLAQRLAVLDMHAMVNVVDSENLLTKVNDLMLAQTGHTRADLIGKPVSTLYDADGLKLAQSIREELVQGRTWQGVTPLRRVDGRTVYTQTTVMPLFDSQGAWSGSISVRTDVTQHHKLMEERDTALTLHELRDDVWIVDETSLQFRYMNRTAMSRLGWRDGDYGDRSLMDLALEHNAAAILDVCAELRRSSAVTAQQELEVLGSAFEVTVKLLRDEGVEGRFLILLADVSDRRAQEQVKADFVSMVSHELRSPLTSIKGSMGLLLSGAAGELPSKATNLLEISHRNADRLVLIINDILDLEKITTGRMDFNLSTVKLGELVGEAISASAMAVKGFGQRLETANIKPDLRITTDPNRVIQVLTNLISNASKFSGPNGVIEVKCEDLGAAGVRVSVRDEGVGIPVEEQHKIFKRFADLSNSDRSSKGGTGLGLSICMAIVESLGGRIGFESTPGAGTTFHFTLPSVMVVTEQADTTGIMRAAG